MASSSPLGRGGADPLDHQSRVYRDGAGGYQPPHPPHRRGGSYRGDYPTHHRRDCPGTHARRFSPRVSSPMIPASVGIEQEGLNGPPFSF